MPRSGAVAIWLTRMVNEPRHTVEARRVLSRVIFENCAYWATIYSQMTPVRVSLKRPTQRPQSVANASLVGLGDSILSLASSGNPMMPRRDARHVLGTWQGRRGNPLGGFAVCDLDRRDAVPYWKQLAGLPNTSQAISIGTKIII
jgi:hypothetical protein